MPHSAGLCCPAPIVRTVHNWSGGQHFEGYVQVSDAVVRVTAEYALLSCVLQQAVKPGELDNSSPIFRAAYYAQLYHALDVGFADRVRLANRLRWGRPIGLDRH